MTSSLRVTSPKINKQFSYVYLRVPDNDQLDQHDVDEVLNARVMIHVVDLRIKQSIKQPRRFILIIP